MGSKRLEVYVINRETSVVKASENYFAMPCLMFVKMGIAGIVGFGIEQPACYGGETGKSRID